jgi:choline dehydrogenase-like flavoprotein
MTPSGPVLHQAEIVVIGTGPAGVSACWPLVEAGRDVLVLDAGHGPTKNLAPDRPSLAILRGHARDGAGRHFQDEELLGNHLLGADLAGLRDVKDHSPKLRTAAARGFTAGYLAANRITTENFSLVGALAQGGLSNVWGAGVSLYDDVDLGAAAYGAEGVRAQDLAGSYRRVAERIGISGAETDERLGDGTSLPMQPPIALSAQASHLLSRSGRRGQNARQNAHMILGRTRNAVLTRELPAGPAGRNPCTQDNMCMWGCAKRAVYCSADELPLLRRHRNFRELSNIVATAILRDGDGYLVEAVDRRDGAPIRVQARNIVLAAGAVPSTRLALQLLEHFEVDVRLQSSPAVSFAMLIPAMLGQPLASEGFALAQLTIRCHVPGADRPDALAFGSVFGAEGVSAADLMAQLPLTRAGAISFIRHLVSSLAIGLVYLPGEYSDNRLRLSRPDEAGLSAMSIRGGVRSDTPAAFKALGRLMTWQMLRCGGVILPGSMRQMSPGAEVHYGASLPMGGAMVSKAGELRAAPGVFIVDGASLPRVAAKHHTFTMMANADRIALHLAARLGA